MNCFYTEKCRFCSTAAGRKFLSVPAGGGENVLQIKAIMEKADALGKYFDSVLHFKAASMLGGGGR